MIGDPKLETSKAYAAGSRKRIAHRSRNER